MPSGFGRRLWAVTVIAIVFTICTEMLFWRAAINAGEWLTLGLIGLLGFLVLSVGLGMLFLMYGP